VPRFFGPLGAVHHTDTSTVVSNWLNWRCTRSSSSVSFCWRERSRSRAAKADSMCL